MTACTAAGTVPRMRTLFLISALVLVVSACKKDEAAQGEPAAASKAAEKPEPAPAAEPAPAPAPEPAAPSGPSASKDKEMLGLDLKPMGEWKPTWDADAKVAKWENEKYMTGIVNRIVDDKLDNIDDLKAAAPMMMQLGSAITNVVEEKKTDKGWYAVVEREKESDLVYVRKFGATVVCQASLTKADLGETIKKDEAIAACESIELKP